MTTAIAAPDLDRAIQHCRDVTRRRARNFYYGLKLLPEPQRSAMFAIYAWMRRADDIVDDPDHGPEKLRRELDAFWSATETALRQKTPADDHDPLWPALAFASSRFALTTGHFRAMLDGQIDDLEDRSYETFDELREYCYRVASTVGLVCIEIWGYADPCACDLAVERGIAFQLTNILRDFREDLDAGRVYLPQEEFRHHGLSPQALRAWSKPEACAAFVNEQTLRAEAHYQRSAPLDAMITPTCRPTLWAMTEIYHGLLRKMIAEPASIVGPKRLRLSSMQKGVIALKAKWFHSTANGQAAQ